MHIDFTISGLQQYGFTGFVRIGQLKAEGYGIIPKHPGLYVVIRDANAPPQFLSNSIGGHFKGRDPSVPEIMLQMSWVDATSVVYIGKAGGGTSAATLYSRLKEYLDFGKGKNVGHWGGRYIWQLVDSDDLQLAWKPLDIEDAREVEQALIRNFELCYGKVFANLAR